MRLAIFGGAFDPPHLGHRRLLEEALRLEFFDGIWLIPTFTPPLKMINGNSNSVASPKERLEMVQLLIDELRHSGKRSADWRRAHPESACPELAERDSGQARMTNDDRLRVLDLEIKRGGKSYTIDTIKELKKLYPQDQFFFLIGSDWVVNLDKWSKIDELYKEVEFIALPRTKISSSKIREKIKNGQSIKGLVPEEIEEYIKKHKLYQ